MPLGAAVFLRGMGVVVVKGMLRIGDIADGKRQNIFSILGILFCFVVRGPDWGAVVDKKRSFCFVFVYFVVRAGAF